MKKERSREKNLLFVLYSFEILLSSGKSLEEAIATIAKNNYGAITNDFKEIIAKTNINNKNMYSVLIEAREQTEISNYRLLFEYLAFSYKNKTNILDNIINIEKKVIKEEITMHKKYENFAVTLMNIYIAALIPAFIFNIVIISLKLLGENELMSYFGIMLPQISPTIIASFYVINAIALGGIIYYVYQANPNNK